MYSTCCTNIYCTRQYTYCTVHLSPVHCTVYFTVHSKTQNFRYKHNLVNTTVPTFQHSKNKCECVSNSSVHTLSHLGGAENTASAPDWVSTEFLAGR